jgi:actin-related protein 5
LEAWKPNYNQRFSASVGNIGSTGDSANANGNTNGNGGAYPEGTAGAGVTGAGAGAGGTETSIASQWQIHLNTERYRVCETWFQPSLAGVDAAGLGELAQGVLNACANSNSSGGNVDSNSILRRLVSNILITGTPSLLPGLIPRLHEALRPVLPVDIPIQIRRAEDPGLDAWKGMAKFARTEEFGSVGMTREEYEEYGGERMKRWWGGNWNGGY